MVAYDERFAPNNYAAIAQLGERQTEDLEVPGSIPGLGSYFSKRFRFWRYRNRNFRNVGFGAVA